MAAAMTCLKLCAAVRSPQPRQTTTSRRPWRSRTDWLPARWWRRSTFWVTSCSSVPAPSQAANARCAIVWARRLEKRGQPGVRARPVATVDRLLRAKGLDHHRRPPLPLAPVVAVVGDAGCGAAAGPGESEDAAMTGNPAPQIVDAGERGHRHRSYRSAGARPGGRRSTSASRGTARRDSRPRSSTPRRPERPRRRECGGRRSSARRAWRRPCRRR